MSEKTMEFTDDKKAVLLKSLKDLYCSAGQLHDWIKNDKLPQNMSEQMVFLIESHFCEIAKELDYDSYLNKEREERYVKIRKANETIHQLKEKLGSKNSIDGLQEQLKNLYQKVSDWWSVEGFNHISEEKFLPYGGLHLQFCFMIDSYRTFSKTPVSDKRSKQDHVKHLRELGFEFADNEPDSCYQKYLIDNQNNRTLLMNMLKNRFPSIEIHSFDNMGSRDTGNFLILHVNAAIYDLTDI